MEKEKCFEQMNMHMGKTHPLIEELIFRWLRCVKIEAVK